MRINKISDCAYYIDAAVNIGVIANQRGEVLLVDAGIDDRVARKVKRVLEESGFKLRGIIITHAHADHYGGAAYLVKAAGVPVYASAAEKSVLEHPLWEPVYLFGGAYPPSPLRSKFFLAPRVGVDLTIAPGLVSLPQFEEQEIEVVDLAGHALGQVGIAVDGVLFCSDAVIAPEFISKHGIPLNAHLGKTLETFDYLLGREGRWFLPAHGTLVDDIKPLVAANRARVDQAMASIREGLSSPLTVEEIVASAGRAFGIEITSLGQYYLTQLTVMAYIGHLLDLNHIRAVYHNNRQSFLLND